MRARVSQDKPYRKERALSQDMEYMEECVDPAEVSQNSHDCTQHSYLSTTAG